MKGGWWKYGGNMVECSHHPPTMGLKSELLYTILPIRLLNSLA